ncbi:MAG: hypothetical protein ACRDPC_06310 [Solirubrobacteraceae bacterium]
MSRERRGDEHEAGLDAASRPEAPAPAGGLHAHLLALQRSAGNAAVARYVPNVEHSPAAGPNLPTGSPRGQVEGIVVCLGTDTEELIDSNHHWIEIGDESYGWWPSRPVVTEGDEAAVLLGTGSPGILNGTSLPRTRGTPTRDPHHGDPANRYAVIDPGGAYSGQAPEAATRAAADAIRRFARSFEADYSWNFMGTDCQEFVALALEAAQLVRGRRQIQPPPATTP